MSNRNIVKLFKLRKGNLDYRVKRDYIRNGIATIPCRISGYRDVISVYSVEGCESLNPAFVEYILSAAEIAPPEYPLVLNIVGDCLTQEEKETIENAIKDDSAYNLGVVEEEEKRRRRIFYGMFFGLLISGVLLWLVKALIDDIPELFFILFWFMGDNLCDYIFLTGRDLRRERILAGKLASIKVVFSESYKEPEYTESDVNKLYSEIERDVKESIQDI